MVIIISKPYNKAYDWHDEPFLFLTLLYLCSHLSNWIWQEGEPVTEQDEPSDKKDNGQEYTAQRLEIATANFIRQSRSTPKDYTALKKRLQTLKKYFDHENEQGTGGTSKSCDIIQNSGAGVLLVDTIKDLMVAGHRTPDLLEQNSEIISVSLHILGNFFHSISEKQVRKLSSTTSY